jgi:ketosteroid isomerase-like protein
MAFTAIEIQCLVEKWIAAWNAHDLDGIMEHYATDVQFEANTVIRRWHRVDGRLQGRDALREHFMLGLELAPDLEFTLRDVLTSPSGYAAVYTRNNGNLVIDAVVLNEQGKAASVVAYYAHKQV